MNVIIVICGKKNIMDIVITQWAFDSYLNLYSQRVFSSNEYSQTLRPDVLLIKQYPQDAKFSNGKFWSFASDASSTRIPDGFKMKWHQIGHGKIHLRLPVALLNGKAYLCEAYVKRDEKVDKRKLAKFKGHIELIRQNKHTECGVL